MMNTCDIKKITILTSVQSFLQTEKELKKNTDPWVDHYAKGRLVVFVKLVTLSFAVGILLAPVLLLFLVPMKREAMAWMVFGFVLAFSVTLSAVTEAKVQEVLIGTAA
jgi:hypothetical protein